MISLLRERPRSVLLIGAHSDDIEIGCGATVLTLLALFPEIKIRWVVLSGEGARTDEARRGAAHFLKDARDPMVEVADFPDAAFAYQAAGSLKSHFRELSANCRPDLVFTHRRDDMHQDHRFVAELTWQHFRDHTILEYEIPKYEGDLGRPGVFVPASLEIAERKIAATVETFATQRDKPWFEAETLRALMRLRGNECRSPTGLAEAFHCAKMVLA